MTCLLIDGKERSAEIRREIKERVSRLVPRLGRPPKLAVVLVGDNPASRVYVSAKSKAAASCGMQTVDRCLQANVTDDVLQGVLRELASSPELDGILLQLPLPPGLNEFGALLSISPSLDVDGLHPFNQGLLMRGGAVSDAGGFEPCTPLGVVDLISWALLKLEVPNLEGRAEQPVDLTTVDFRGANAVVVGRSVLVGKPLAAMLTNRNCTVTVCHSRTKNLSDVCRQADILVAAIGKPEFVDAGFVKPGAVVIDVGINRLADGKLVGDVNYAQVSQVAGALTPVPGGVGPMTIAMLLKNTLLSAERKAGV